MVGQNKFGKNSKPDETECRIPSHDLQWEKKIPINAG